MQYVYRFTAHGDPKIKPATLKVTKEDVSDPDNPDHIWIVDRRRKAKARVGLAIMTTQGWDTLTAEERIRNLKRFECILSDSPQCILHWRF